MSSLRLAALLLVTLLVCIARAEPVAFGVSPAHGHIPTVEEIEDARASGARIVNIRAHWPTVQPAPGAWRFAELDEAVLAAASKGMRVILTLGPTPRWAVRYLQAPTDEEVARAKPDPDALRIYAAALAQRYQKNVTYYRLWEAPTAATLLAIPRDVHALYRAATSGIHAVNPALKVIAAEPGGVNLEWIAAYLGAAKGAEAPDILALTPSRFPLTTETFWWRCSVLRARILSADGPALWMEAPVENGVRLAAAALAHDISILLFPPGAAVPPILLPLQDSSYTGWLPVSLEAVGGVFTADDRRFRLDVPLAEGEPAVRDSHAGHCRPGTPAVAPLRVTADTVALDVYGENPRALRPLPGLPGGRYTLTFLGSQPVLATERHHNPWLHLDVPDGFLFYNRDGVPVEVTVRLYGARKAQRTGFNLYYDARGGMNNTRWQWIDVGPTKVFTYSLRLDDALFSNREGYDFRICTGGSDEDLRIVGVTVKKLAK